MTLNESVLADIKGKEHNEAHATASEPYYQVLAGADEITRLLKSSKLANSASEDNGGSINSASHKLDGENARSQSGKNSRPDLKFVEISEDFSRSNEVGPDGESEEELDTDSEYESEETNNDSEYESEETDNDSEYDTEDESNDDSEDESGIEEDMKRSCKSEEEKSDSQSPGHSYTFLRKISELGEDSLYKR